MLTNICMQHELTNSHTTKRMRRNVKCHGNKYASMKLLFVEKKEANINKII